MAIEQKALEDIFNSEGEQSAKIEKILAMAKEDLDNELNAIKINREEIKDEKVKLQAKYKTLEEQFNTLQKDNSALSEKLKNSTPEEFQKIYDQKMAESALVYERQLQDLTKDRDAYKQKAEAADKLALQLDVRTAFNKAIEGKNIAPDALSDFAAYVLGVECEKFTKKPLGDGQEVLANREGKTIEQSIKDALETSFGKRCVQVTSSGGGAEGTAWSMTPESQNPFITGNMTQQARLFTTDRARYEKLKAMAIAAGKYKA